MQETCGFDSWARKITWRRKWQPAPVFVPENIPVPGVIKNHTQLVNWAQCNQKWDLATYPPQKPKKKLGWWKGKCALYCMLTTGVWGRVALTCPKANSPTDNQWARTFINKERGIYVETTQSAYSHLEMDHLWSDQRHLDCFKYS